MGHGSVALERGSRALLYGRRGRHGRQRLGAAFSEQLIQQTSAIICVSILLDALERGCRAAL